MKSKAKLEVIMELPDDLKIMPSQCLPEEIISHVYKMHMVHNVLPDFMDKHETFTVCMSCCLHGSPCIMCAHERHCGSTGAGHFCGERVIIWRTCSSILQPMLTQMLMNSSDVLVVDAINDIARLPQNQHFMNAHA